MNILITGAAGFIGSHVCEFYLDKGNYVVGIDNFDDFYPKKIKQENLEILSKYADFHFHELDIRAETLLDDLFSTESFDLVIHLAAKAGVRPSIDSITEYYDVNVNGTVCILQLMKKHNVTKMLFASSSSVYGNNIKVPFSESDSVDNPISPYAATKKSGELLCHVFSHLYDFDISCLRFFTVYGPRQRPDLAIHKFTRLIDEGKPIPFYSDGTTARDYTYIDDIVKGIDCALNQLKGYHIYNLGGSNTTNLTELVQIIEQALGKEAILTHLPIQQGDVKMTYADISKSKVELGYNPTYNIKSGIQLFIEWYNKNKKFF